MYSVNLVIKKNYVMADGTTHIYIQYSLTRENRRLIKTGKKIQPEYWDQSSEKVKRNFEHAGEYNSVLNLLKHRLENIIDTAILQGDIVTLDYVEKKFYNKCGTQSPKEKDFFVLLDEYLQSKVGQVSKDVVKDYYTLMKHLKGFQGHSGETIRFNKIDLRFYENFVRYLEFTVVKKNGEVGMQKNSVGKLIKNLKGFLNNSMRKKLIEPIDLTSFKTTTAQVDDIYLTEQELESIEKLDLTKNPFLSKIRHMFLIGCETGLRYSDLNRLDWQHIQGNFIQIKVKKTTSRVIIPISTRVRRILELYQMPDFPSGIHMNYFNPEIKHIAFLAGINSKFSKWKIIGNQKTEITKSKHLFVSSHTCRRTFCTNQFLKGMPPILIRKISGHKDETSFLKYIKIDEEEAAQKMFDLWIQ